jgi:mono/diheme cytochrome c family protein
MKVKAPHALTSTFAITVLCLAAAPLPAAAQQYTQASKAQSSQVERGRYLVKVTGCNDCHTAGYAMAGGKVPEAQWLTGDKLGWRGPWGTTYPVNLRLYMTSMSESGWVQTARNLKSRPPMPWFALHDMTDEDLQALYQYVQWLGPAGELAPAFVPPGREPKTPVVQFPAPPS